MASGYSLEEQHKLITPFTAMITEAVGTCVLVTLVFAVTDQRNRQLISNQAMQVLLIQKKGEGCVCVCVCLVMRSMEKCMYI